MIGSPDYGMLFNVPQLQPGLSPEIVQNIATEIQKRKAQEQEAIKARQIQDEFLQLTAGSATPNDYISFLGRHPDMAAPMKTAFSIQNEAQQAEQIQDNKLIYGLVNAGMPEKAVEYLRKKSKAYLEAGDKSRSDGFEAMSRIIDIDPHGGKALAALNMALTMDKDKFATNYTALAAVPGDISDKYAASQYDALKKQADIKKIEADISSQSYNDQLRAKEMGLREATSQADIKKIEADISSQSYNDQLRAKEMELRNATSDIDRQKKIMEIQKMEDESSAKALEREYEYDSSIATINSASDTVDELLNFDPSVIARRQGVISSMLPTVISKSRDLEAKIEELISKVSLAQIDKLKGTGSITEGEHKMLQSSLGSLGPKQSAKQLTETLTNIKYILINSKIRTARKYGKKYNSYEDY